MKRIFLAIAFSWLVLAGGVSAQSAKDLAFEGYSHKLEGADRVFTLRVRNTSAKTVRVRGRLMLINVYDTSLPQTTVIDDLIIPAGDVLNISARWKDAPAYGRMRVFLILNDGDAFISEAFDLWFVPTTALLITGGVLLLIIALVVFKVRMSGHVRRKWTAHVPSGMAAHFVEEGDTVVSLSNSFGGTWQDIVKANHLKPPYTLKPGTRILIPKHDIKRPEEAPKPPPG